MVQKKIKITNKILRYLPLILLYFSVLNEFDIDTPSIGFLSFNLPFIIIFYWSLKDPDHIGNGLIFIAGILNDVTLGYPIGLSSFIYLIIIAFASYLRNITLRPNIYKDSIVFLIAILFANSVNASILSFIFSIEIIFFEILVNISLTFLLYFLFAKMFNYLKPVGA
jgi:rod shape-determining protein MreD|tara:strand:+ start:475 stop:975 length:501 start_codon:yes stop_codon:yes gene_type:complete